MSGLLRCMNHPEPHKVSSLNSKGRYVCQRDYLQEGTGVCLDITAHFLDEPLTATVLSQLDLTPFTEEILSRLESEDGRSKLEERQTRQQVRKLEEEIRKWRLLLPCCVDGVTGRVDREREEFYWEQIREAQRQIRAINAKPVHRDTVAIDFNKVREFLKGLTSNWRTYSLASRNQLFKLIIETVELRGSQDIEATVVWKTGFRQKVIIHRPQSNSKLERRWSEEEDGLLRMMYPSSSPDVLMAALTNRSWKAITLRAQRLDLRRVKSSSNRWQKWTREEDKQLSQLYRDGIKYEEIARVLRRSETSVATRVRDRGLSTYSHNKTRRIPANWETRELISFQELSSRGGQRG